MDSTKSFDKLLNDIINHPFLHYHPFLLDDNKVIEDAQERAKHYSKFPNSIIEYLDQSCCRCYIGSIKKEENPYTTDGEMVEYKTIPIIFFQNEETPQIIVNKSDFNPRQYLTICGCTIFTSNILFADNNCDKYTSKRERHAKTCSTINGDAEVENYQDCSALLAYSIPVMSGFGSARMAYRLYTIENNEANVIREKILQTQQYILSSIIHYPQSIVTKHTFNETIFSNYLVELKQMYEFVCVEIKQRGIEPVVQEEYLPSILDNVDTYFSHNNNESLLMEYYEETEDYKISKYEGLFAIKEEHSWYDLLDRNGNIFKPRFRNSVDYIASKYLRIFYEQIEGEGLIVCHGDDIYQNYEVYDYEEDDDFVSLRNKYEHEFYFDEDVVDAPKIYHKYLGLINKYGQTIFQLKSTCHGSIDMHGKLIFEQKNITSHFDNFKFIAYDNRYVIICLENSYNIEKNCYTRCGAIDIETGALTIPLIFTEDEIRKELSYGWAFEDKRYYNPGWKYSYYCDDAMLFTGPIYKRGTDILEQGKYAGHTIEDALYFYGKEILSELIFENKIFIADTVFPNNIAHFSSVQRSIKLYQDKFLQFNPITCLDDTISTYNGFMFAYQDNDIIFSSLYEGKTLQEIIEDEKGMFYVKHLISEGVLKVTENVIDELIDTNGDLYLPLREAFDSQLAILEEHNDDCYIDDTDYERETYYALGGDDYEKWRNNGGNIDDMMDECGF